MSLLRLIRDVELAARASLESVVRPMRLGANQYLTLTLLERSPGMTAAQLAARSFVTRQSMADTITALGAMHMISRHRNAQDRRAWRLKLTAAGRDLVARARPAVHGLERRVLADLGEMDTDDLQRVLHACARALGVRARDAG